MSHDDEIDKELRFHLDSRIDDLVASGVALDEARRQARLEFGGVMQTKEAVRDLRPFAIVDGLAQDIRLAFRTLLATPVVTAVAILSLALGIGANTALFSLVNSLLLRTLPVSEPQRLAVISDSRAIRGERTAGWSYPIWEQLRQRAQPFDGSCAWSTERFNLAQSSGDTQPVDGIYASGGYFTTLGVPAVLGRTFTVADDMPDGGKDGRVAVISYALWQRLFEGSAAVVGRSLVVERVPFTIIGVTPPAFFGAEVGRTVDVALPLSTEPLLRGRDSRYTSARAFYGLTVLLRLRVDQSIDTANAIVAGMVPQIRAAAMPSTLSPLTQKGFLKDGFTLVPAASGTSKLRARYERPLLTIFIVVALVLLVACANIANLQLARAEGRRRDVSVRVALGASRWRLMRQWLVESLLLSGIGSVLGLLIASWSSRALVAPLSTVANRVYLDLSVDWRVLAFTATVAIATAVLFGTLPALCARHAEPLDALNEQGRRSSSGARLGVSNGLIISQVALSLVIVVGAGLFARTFEKLATVPLGFDSDRVLLVSGSLARTRATTGDPISFVHRLVRELRGLNGVSMVAASLVTPLLGGSVIDNIRFAGLPPSFEAASSSGLTARGTYGNFITPGWFATYGTPLKAGRDFDEHDTKEAPPVMIVNEAFVRKFLPVGNPLGQTVEFERGRAAPMVKTVVGVVADAVYGSLRNDTSPTEYVPLAQSDFEGPVPDELSLSIRSSAGSPMLLTRSVAAALGAIDHDLVVTFRPLADQVDASLTQERVIAMLAGFFAALALLLAGLGLYGVTSYAVSRRRTEIGIRMALGAAPGGVVRLVLARVALLVGGGVAVGAGVSIWASTFVAALLYGLEPRDPSTLAGAALILAAVGAAAGWLPAYRASRTNPAVVLRDS